MWSHEDLCCLTAWLLLIIAACYCHDSNRGWVQDIDGNAVQWTKIDPPEAPVVVPQQPRSAEEINALLDSRLPEWVRSASPERDAAAHSE